MSLDLAPVRAAIAAVVDRVPEILTVAAEEHRDYPLSSLPLAMIWRDVMTTPGVGEPQGELGNLMRTFNWQIRVFVKLDDDVATQLLVDRITIGLVEQFAADPFLQASGTPVVDQAALTQITPQPVLDVEPALFLIEASLDTVITWTGG